MAAGANIMCNSGSIGSSLRFDLSKWSIDMRIVALAVVVAFIAGCATNSYAEFYNNAPGVTPEMIASGRSNPPPNELQIPRHAGP
jgi:hypothetical protein